MRLNELFSHVNDETEVTGLQIDSRKVRPGDLFVCIKGYTVNGHDFARQAEDLGAVAIVCEHPVEGVTIPQIEIQATQASLPFLAHIILNKPTANMNLFGVTGTNGKTTVSYIMEHLLKYFDVGVGYIGTNGIRYGEVAYEPVNTTPNALDLQATFADMVARGVQNVSLEVSSHALALHRVDCCEFKVAVFTNLTPEHLDFHPTMEDYFEAKYKLFTMIEEGGYAVINIDDEYGQRIVKRLRELGTNVYTCSCKREADFRAIDINMHSKGTSFTLKAAQGDFKVNTPMLGMFNVDNTLGAIAAMVSAGMDTQVATDAMSKLPGVDGRMELINEGQDFTVIVDYAHTPDGVEKVLEFAQGIKKTDIKLVIGCPGDRDKTKRPVIANLCAKGADDVVFTTDDPHSEDPLDILNDMIDGLNTKNYKVVIDRKSAIEQVIHGAKKDDVVIIAGRGHQKLQYFSSGNIEFDDREIVREILRTKSKEA